MRQENSGKVGADNIKKTMMEESGLVVVILIVAVSDKKMQFLLQHPYCSAL